MGQGGNLTDPPGTLSGALEDDSVGREHHIVQASAGAGSNTRVAVQDAALPGGGLTSYYSERGEAPEVWVGSGWRYVRESGTADSGWISRWCKTDCKIDVRSGDIPTVEQQAWHQADRLGHAGFNLR